MKTYNLILTWVIISIFSITLVSAADWDNVKSYNASSQTIEISNSILNIPILKLGKVADIQLHTPTVYPVIRGKNRMVAEFTITNYGEYSNVFKKMEFYNNRDNGHEIERNFTYKYKKSLGFKNVSDYEEICSEATTSNKTVIKKCNTILIGSHQEEVFGWEALDINKPLPKGNTTIGIFTDVLPLDDVEWIPTFYGVRIPEWATWTDFLNVGLVEYWNFDQSSGNISIGSLNKYNLTSNSSTWVSGKNNNAMNFSNSTSQFARTTSNITEMTNQNMTINGWIKLQSGTSGGGVSGIYKLGQNFNEGNSETVEMGSGDNGFKRLSAFSPNSLATGPDNSADYNGTFFMLTLTYNAATDNITVYKNTEFVATASTAASIPAGEFWLARSTQNGFTGIVADEIGLWNRTLNSTELSYLYDSGTGTFFSAATPPTININSPPNNYSSQNRTVVFNVTPTSPSANITSVSILLDGIINQTNTSGLSGVAYLFYVDLISEGNHNWSISATDSLSQTTNTTNRSLTIDLTNPAVNITTPTNVTTRTNYTDNSTLQIQINYTASDTNLQACWLEYNGTNTTIPGCANTTRVLPYGTHTFKIWANDTSGRATVSQVTGTWDYKLLQNSITYDAQAYEISEETFSINMSSDGTQTVTGRLVYNGAAYNGTKSGDNTLMTFTRNITIPTTGNLSFYWSFNYGSEVINSSTYYQNVSAVTLTNCTSGTIYFNVTVRDEGTQNLLNASNNVTLGTNFIYFINDRLANKTFNSSFTNVNNVSFCLTPSTVNITLFGQIEYEDATHVKENYYFVDDTFSNSTTVINLYDLLTTESTSFVVYLVDSASLPVEDSYFELKREYVATNEFKIVEMARSDNFGIGILHFVTEDENYKLDFFDDDGDLLYSTTEFRAVCLDTVCSLTFTIPFSTESDPFEDLEDDPNFDFTLNKTNDVVYLVFNSDNGTGYNVRFEVFGISVANDTVSLCSQSQSSVSSGSAQCNVSGQNYDSFLARVWVNGQLEVSRYVAEFNDEWQTWGTEGVFYALVIVIALTLLFAWHWVLALLGSVAGLVLSVWLHFIPGTFSTISYLVVVIIYLIVTGGGRNSQ